MWQEEGLDGVLCLIAKSASVDAAVVVSRLLTAEAEQPPKDEHPSMRAHSTECTK